MSDWAKTGLLGAAALSALVSTAGAADLQNKVASVPEPPPPVFSWQGGYVGAYAGALLGEGSFTFINETPVRGAAFLGGGALGYNWQWTDKILLGAEADFGYRGPLNVANIAYTYPSQVVAGVLGTFRGRVGYLFAPRWLAYLTAGLAFGTGFLSNNFISYAPFTYGVLTNGTTVRAGWTAGAGFEYAWSDQLSFKGEYLYTSFESASVPYQAFRGIYNVNVGSAGHVVRAGVNFHFAANAITAPPVLTK